MNPLKTLHLFASDYDRARSIELAHWCLARGADEMSITPSAIRGGDTAFIDRFAEAMRPYQRDAAPRRHLVSSPTRSFVWSTNLWTVSRESLVTLALFLPGGLFGGRSDGESWLEDPIVYRRGEVMLGIVTRENEGILRVTLNERTMLGRGSLRYRSEGRYVVYAG